MGFVRACLFSICLPAMMGINVGWAQTVVPNDNVFFGGSQSLQVAQDVAGTDFTSVIFGNNSGTLSLGNFTLDEGSDWYEVVPSEELSVASTLAGNNDLWGTSLDPSLFPVSRTSIDVTVPFFANPLQLTATSEFYVGFATNQAGTNPSGPEDRDVFGWARVVAFGSGAPGEPQSADFFEIHESAIAYDSAGIIVGTTQAISVPEPSSNVVLFMGTLLLARRRRLAVH